MGLGMVGRSICKDHLKDPSTFVAIHLSIVVL
jgi:hypothetical protein